MQYLHVTSPLLKSDLFIYRRTGFKCEHVIIANCDFSPRAQLLEHNVYITYSINQYVARA